MEKELKDLAECVETFNKQNKTQAKASSDCFAVEKTIDEIVSFINGGPGKKGNRRRRVSKASTAETSGSPFRQRSLEKIWTALEEKSNSIDKEVREFQAKLESTQPLFQRLKPSLSEEWIKKIRGQIIKNN
jgi:hypothetical protein